MGTTFSAVLAWCALLASVAMADDAVSQVAPDEVTAAIGRGVAFLRQSQQADGGWPEMENMPQGVTALCTLAMLRADVDAADPQLQRALSRLRNQKPEKTYPTALQTLVFCRPGVSQDLEIVRRNVKWLVDTQVGGGERKGAWGYPGTSGDNSNTQFALFALREAQRQGIAVRREVWQSALAYWIRTQNADGSWGYQSRMPGSGSMTSAGVASANIAVQALDGKDPLVKNASRAIERGVAWLAAHYGQWRDESFLTHQQPGPLAPRFLYFIDAIREAAELSGREQIGQYDWYVDGALTLVKSQDPKSGAWEGTGVGESRPPVATSLALLFLTGHREHLAAAPRNASK